MEKYKVRSLGLHPRIQVTVPGSKSITNRALLMAAMAQGSTELKGVLFSEDSRVFLAALQDLGFRIQIREEEKAVLLQGEGGHIPQAQGRIYVGCAGTAARFLTAFVAMSEGEYVLDAAEQMKHRPMKELLDALRQLGAEITCLEGEDTFPMRIRGMAAGREQAGPEQGAGLQDREEGKKQGQVSLNIDRSSQFLSALLMVAPIRFHRLTVRLTGNRNARSYVEITRQMMEQFGHPGVIQLEKDCYQVQEGRYQARSYQVEPDLSAACYFYGAAAITGGRAKVWHVRRDSLQGDKKFLLLLEQMGCRLDWQEDGLVLQGPEPGRLCGVTVDMGDFSDQALTLAAIAPYASGPVTVEGIGHIRGQECDRIHAVADAMERLGVPCQEREDGFSILPAQPRPAAIQTFGDHRVAMAFAVTGLRAEGIVIEDPACCGKTFEGYFQVLDQVIDGNN